jgi:predicted AlkP superfamily phosphohydrolase/phosphomutase
MLLGLDCVPPALAFDRYRAELPCLSALIARGAHAHLRSTFPPITVPAWTSMVSGRDPGELGLYGFRERKSGSYDLTMVSSENVRVERVWDVLARHQKRSSLLFVPPSFPPFSVEGEMVGCFLTPTGEHDHTLPRKLKGELEARFGSYVPDVEVRKAERSTLCDQLIAMTEQHFAMAEHVWRTREPDFLMMVEIGPDRLHHAFFADMDPSHPAHDPHGAFVGEGARYYRALDAALARLVSAADEDTAILIASDHGAKPLHYAFCINEWLLREGYLVLREPVEPGALRPHMVDWTRTRAWAEGGYYARVFLNVRGREPYGVIEPEHVLREREALCAALRDVPGRDGKAMHNIVEPPERLYRAVQGNAPDLLAVFADLSVRALSTVGTGELYAHGDDRGADACNHDWDGIFVLAGPGVSARGSLGTVSIHDVGASVLALFGIDKPEDWLGVDRSKA